MRAAVFAGEGRVRVEDVPDPEIRRDDDAIVRVTRAAICGSDLHFVHLKAPIDPGEVLGHEAVGVVASVGDAVTEVRPGDRVVIAFNSSCGRCWFCDRGQTSLCDEFANFGAGAFSGGLSGTQAELVRVPHAGWNLLPIPDGVEDEAAVFVADVATTGYYGASLAAAAKGDTVAVIGAGPVGFCLIQSLLALGAGRVVALDREPARLALAAAAGAITVDVTARNPEMALAELTDDRGADVAIDAVGHPDAYESSLDVVRRGGRVVVVGMYAGEVTDLQLGVYWARALDVRFAGICPVQAWWRPTMDAIAAGRLDPTPLVSHRLPLAEAPDGYRLFDRHEATKVLLIP